MRELKYHEQKLLKKVDFLQWKSDQTLQEIKVMRRYHVQNRDDYKKYQSPVRVSPFTFLGIISCVVKFDD